ncbi:MAG: hypothetical protein IPK62_07975 [Bacteroidetes bacterium]|nr:hypothetical protein [Bacteroidota bacterium]MBP6314883.1 hypothetical protein [Chitinophagaceae bacterium]
MANVISTEKLEDEEAAFIINKYQKASKDYLRIMNLFLISCGVFPLVMGVLFSIIANDFGVFIGVFVICLISLIFFFILVASIYYFLFLFRKYLDAQRQTKTIERCLVLEKKAILINQSYHIFIDSKVKYSIEVVENDYDLYEIGDEINIEYSTYDKEYLGYF